MLETGIFVLVRMRVDWTICHVSIIVVPLFQLSNAPKKDKKQVINEVSVALKEAVSDGRFAKDAKAFRKGTMYTK